MKRNMAYGYCFTDRISILNQRTADAELRIVLSMRSLVHVFCGSMLHPFGIIQTSVHALKSYISELHHMLTLQNRDFYFTM